MNKFMVAVLAIVGACLTIGGGWLIALGGSSYYLPAGLALIAAAALLRRSPGAALWLYAGLTLATLVWALWERGSDFWALAPRLDVIGILGALLLLPAAARRDPSARTPRMALFAALCGVAGTMIYALFNDPQEVRGALALAGAPKAGAADPIPAGDWPAYARDQKGSRFSPLTQITAQNAPQLKQAWVYNTRDIKTENDSGETTNEVTPIKVGDGLYICTPHQVLVALDPASGGEKWRFDPKLKGNKSFQHMTCRGVTYHDAARAQTFPASLQAAAQPTSSQVCPRKILLPVNDGRLIAVNPDDGKPCADFGENGEVDLQLYMPNAYPGGYNPTSPPVVTATTIVIGGSVTDNLSTKEPSGAIRGYDVNTGALKWVFDPGAKDPNAMPQVGGTYVHNSPNAWAPFAYDAQTDAVYVPTGVATPDIWGGNRTPELERFASSLVVLNATTGKLVWSYQTVHHDLWDMDVPSQPTLADIDVKGQRTPVVYVPTKFGNIFVLDRRDGRLVVPAPETPVPQGAAKGDWVTPTQPYSQFTLRPKDPLTDKDMWGATMLDQLACRIIFKRLRYEGPFTPPSEQGTLVFPGNLGMFEWGGISVDPDNQTAVMNPMALPFVSRLIPRGPNNPLWPKDGKEGQSSGTEAGVQPQYGVPFGVTLNPFLSPIGIPCKQPAWGYVAGVDLKADNAIVWKRRVGTIRDSVPGLQLPPAKIGMPMLGGPISTAGGVMFLAATQDNYLRAFDVRNGDEIWRARLPGGGQATPMTYEAGGKQYVVVMAGGHGSFGTTMGDALVAYALP